MTPIEAYLRQACEEAQLFLTDHFFQLLAGRAACLNLEQFCQLPAYLLASFLDGDQMALNFLLSIQQQGNELLLVYPSSCH